MGYFTSVSFGFVMTTDIDRSQFMYQIAIRNILGVASCFTARILTTNACATRRMPGLQQVRSRISSHYE